MSVLREIAETNPDSRRFAVQETPIGVAEILDSCAGIDFIVVQGEEGLTIETDKESWSCPDVQDIWLEIC